MLNVFTHVKRSLQLISRMNVFEFAPQKVHLVTRRKRNDLNSTQSKFFDSMWLKLSQPFDTKYSFASLLLSQCLTQNKI